MTPDEIKEKIAAIFGLYDVDRIVVRKILTRPPKMEYRVTLGDWSYVEVGPDSLHLVMESDDGKIVEISSNDVRGHDNIPDAIARGLAAIKEFRTWKPEPDIVDDILKFSVLAQSWMADLNKDTRQAALTQYHHVISRMKPDDPRRILLHQTAVMLDPSLGAQPRYDMNTAPSARKPEEVQEAQPEAEKVEWTQVGRPWPAKATPEPEPEPEKVARTCNLHFDCDAANAKARAAGRHAADHCHDDACEECFGT